MTLNVPIVLAVSFYILKGFIVKPESRRGNQSSHGRLLPQNPFFLLVRAKLKELVWFTVKAGCVLSHSSTKLVLVRFRLGLSFLLEKKNQQLFARFLWLSSFLPLLA